MKKKNEENYDEKIMSLFNPTPVLIFIIIRNEISFSGFTCYKLT